MKSRAGRFLKNYFQNMDLPLPWFCSSFWKVKKEDEKNFLIGKSALTGHDMHMSV